MLGSNSLEIAIGIVFIYLLLSLICTVVNESIANITEQRGKNLLAGIQNLLNDPSFTGLAQYLYTHGLVGGVMQGVTDFEKTNRLPSYIAPTNFALALIDILQTRGAAPAAAQKATDVATVAENKTNANKDDKALQDAHATAQAALTAANTAAQKVKAAFDNASSEAQKAGGIKNFGKVKEVSDAIESALATGRAIAQEFPDPLDAIEHGINELTNGHAKLGLLTLVDKTRRDLALVADKVRTGERAVEKFGENLENWFNSSMDRFAGWYKRWTRQICFVIGAILVIIANADTLALANRLARDGALRSAIVNAADTATQKMAGDFAAKDHSEVQQARQKLLEEAEKLNLPLGWVDPKINDAQDPFESERIPTDPLGWLLKVIGLLISALAVSLGAPFWFDTLSKFMNVRGAGKVPDSKAASAQSTT